MNGGRRGAGPANGGRCPRGRRLTALQAALYWREWGAVRTALRARGYSPAEADCMRGELHLQALGEEVSSKDLTNTDFDKVLGAFRAVSRPDDLGAQMAAEDAPKRRMIYGIERLETEAGREGYAASLCEDIYGHRDWRRLDGEELVKLRATLARRIERREAEPEPAADAAAAAVDGPEIPF